jgi:hypothetical protein
VPPVTFRKDAIQIIEDVKEAVRQWTHYAETGGVLSHFARDPHNSGYGDSGFGSVGGVKFNCMLIRWE